MIPLIEEHGWENITVNDITTAANISRRKFFRLFRGKDEVYSCDHEVYHLEVHAYLLQHQGERTFGRAARGAALVVDALTAVPGDAAQRQTVLHSHPSLLAEELLWYQRYQSVIVDFLTGGSTPSPTIATEMTAAAIVAAIRSTVARFVVDSSQPAEQIFNAAVKDFHHARISPSRQVALIETELSVEEILGRLDS